MADLVAAIIDRSCACMKNDFLLGYHDYWECKSFATLSHLPYATKDAYVSYEMYRMILIMTNGLCHHHYPINSGDIQPALRGDLNVRFTMNEGSLRTSSRWRQTSAR